MTTFERERFHEIFKSIIATRQKSKDEEDFKLDDWSQTASPSAGGPRASRNDASYRAAQEFLSKYQDSTPPSPVKYRRRAPTEYAQDETYQAARRALYSCKTHDALMTFLDTEVLGPFIRGELSLADISSPRVGDLDVATFCTAYPRLLVESMTVLRLAYRDYAGVITLFRRVKQLGVESQVIGVDVALYNELLITAFEGYRDVAMVLDFLGEMQADGIHADAFTLEILRKVSREIVAEKEASAGGMLYWTRAVKATKLEHLSKSIAELAQNVEPDTARHERGGYMTEGTTSERATL